VYDAATNAWHERAALVNGRYKRHRSNCQARFNGEPVVGDFENGNLYAYDLAYFSDNGAEQKWLRSWRALAPGQNNLFRTLHRRLQLDCQTGVGLSGYTGFETLDLLLAESGDTLTTESGDSFLVSFAVTQGSDPKMMLRWSDDGGHTWSHEHWKDVGRIGATQTRVIWTRLGATLKSRDRVYEVSGSDPVVTAIMGADLILDGTNA
jgi:hypothetical protein